MHRYLVFTGSINNPLGGMFDFKKDFSNLEEANKFVYNNLKNNINEWVHLYDQQDKLFLLDWYYRIRQL